MIVVILSISVKKVFKRWVYLHIGDQGMPGVGGGP